MLSSRHEAAGVAVLEAAACGVPTVGTDTGYVADWSPDAAWSVPPGDADSLADAIGLLLLDRERREAMGRHAERRARSYDADWSAAPSNRSTTLVAAAGDDGSRAPRPASANIWPMPLTNFIHAYDAHACGEHGRVIVGGVPHLPGRTVFEKMCWLREHGDALRLRMLREPRGYPAANCNLVVPPCHPDAAAGYIIMEQVEYPGMSGTNTICVVTVLLETGMLPMQEPVTELTLETPAGLIRVRADCAGGKVTRVTFRNVPAFVVRLDAVVEVPRSARSPWTSRTAACST